MGGAIQGLTPSLTPAVSTSVGSSAIGSADGTGTAASFWNPEGITTDGKNLYVADSGNNSIRRVGIAFGNVSTIAGAGTSGGTDSTGRAASFFNPQGITTDGSNLFVADSGNNTIRKIVIATGVVTTIAGSALNPADSLDGTGTAARFKNPQGITTDGRNLYVADSGNNTIRKIVIATGVVNTFAGSASNPADSLDGTGTTARFNNPIGISTDGANVYVADSGNSTIRKIVIATGVVTTLAGSAGNPGSVNGTGAFARFNGPFAITTDGKNLYITDDASTLRKVVIATGVVTTLAGSPGLYGSMDGDGFSVSFDTGVAVPTFGTARFWFPEGITTDGRNLFVADSVNNTIRKVD